MNERIMKLRSSARHAPGSPILTWVNAPYTDHKIRREHWEPIKKLAQICKERAELSTFGNRDALALEYWIGACTAWRIAGFEALSDDAAKLGALEVSTKGFSAIVALALF